MLERVLKGAPDGVFEAVFEKVDVTDPLDLAVYELEGVLLAETGLGVSFATTGPMLPKYPKPRPAIPPTLLRLNPVSKRYKPEVVAKAVIAFPDVIPLAAVERL
jgi:hypothetical protein